MEFWSAPGGLSLVSKLWPGEGYEGSGHRSWPVSCPQQENDAKRSRALRKAHEEQKLVVQRGAEVDQIQQEIAQLRVVKEKLQQRLAAHKAFPEYLQKVLEKAEQVREQTAVFET